jgi:hypothetical protein
MAVHMRQCPIIKPIIPAFFLLACISYLLFFRKLGTEATPSRRSAIRRIG